MTENQKTVKKPIRFTGRGLHTGTEVVMTIQPASENYGIQISRTDLNESPVVRALAENVVETSRGTTLEENGVRVSTIEHTLAALSGLGIDNARIELNGPEAPILDGSSRFFAEGILNAGIKELNEPQTVYDITEKIEYRDDEHGIEIVAYPDDKLQIDIQIDYRSKVLGFQYASIDGFENFATDIAPARTFVFLHEIEFLLKNNLIKGGDIDNAIVIIDRKVSQEELNF